MHQTRLLARTFFARMFESELMPEGLPQVQLIIWSMVLAATPTMGYPLLLRRDVSDADRVILITLTMITIGIVGLVTWEGVFPDRRDVRILGPLPIPTRRLVLARLAALAQVFGLFAAAVCVPQSVIFGLQAAAAGEAIGRLHGIAAHLATVFSASIFVYCSLIAAQCLLLVVAGRRAAQAASMTFQLIFAVGLLQMLVFLGAIGRALGHGARSQDGLSAIAALPPTWFFGLYELLSGDATLVAFGRVALLATFGAVGVAVALYAISYSYLSRRALDGPPPQSLQASRTAVSRALGGTARSGFRSPRRTAIRQFATRTLWRSRSHRMILAVYGGVALAIVMSSFMSVAMRSDGTGLWRPGAVMLSLPLIVQFLLLVGIRVIIAIPAEPKARWLFRACEPADRADAVSAARDMMVTLVVIPTAVLALVQGLVFWDVWAALSHAAFLLVVGILFAEGLVAYMAKLPFACTYFPGRSRAYALWPLYFTAFSVYSLVLGSVDRSLIGRPVRLLIFCACAVGLTQALALYRAHTLAELPGLKFEEEDPSAIFEGFHLSEGLAAAPRPLLPNP
jgi:hypothetical protein